MSTMRRHLPEYVIEAACLATFMLSASFFTVLLEHPDGPGLRLVADAGLRRALMGLAMGLTAAAIIYSPPGMRSGAHMNPAVTLAWARLGRVARVDVTAYIVAQFAGGIAGMVIAGWLFGPRLADSSVAWVATRPTAGIAAAFAAELAMTFILMLVVLVLSNHARWTARTGLAAAALVALFITIEAPISGMSINPARSFGPALVSGDFTGLWIYLTAPVTGALLAAESYARWRGLRAVFCAKFHHGTRGGCIFACRFDALARASEG